MILSLTVSYDQKRRGAGHSNFNMELDCIFGIAPFLTCLAIDVLVDQMTPR